MIKKNLDIPKHFPGHSYLEKFQVVWKEEWRKHPQNGLIRRLVKTIKDIAFRIFTGKKSFPSSTPSTNNSTATGIKEKNITISATGSKDPNLQTPAPTQSLVASVAGQILASSEETKELVPPNDIVDDSTPKTDKFSSSSLTPKTIPVSTLPENPISTPSSSDAADHADASPVPALPDVATEGKTDEIVSISPKRDLVTSLPKKEMRKKTSTNSSIKRVLTEKFWSIIGPEIVIGKSILLSIPVIGPSIKNDKRIAGLWKFLSSIKSSQSKKSRSNQKPLHFHAKELETRVTSPKALSALPLPMSFPRDQSHDAPLLPGPIEELPKNNNLLNFQARELKTPPAVDVENIKSERIKDLKNRFPQKEIDPKVVSTCSLASEENFREFFIQSLLNPLSKVQSKIAEAFMPPKKESCSAQDKDGKEPSEKLKLFDDLFYHKDSLESLTSLEYFHIDPKTNERKYNQTIIELTYKNPLRENLKITADGKTYPVSIDLSETVILQYLPFEDGVYIYFNDMKGLPIALSTNLFETLKSNLQTPPTNQSRWGLSGWANKIKKGTQSLVTNALISAATALLNKDEKGNIILPLIGFCLSNQGENSYPSISPYIINTSIPIPSQKLSWVLNMQISVTCEEQMPPTETL